MGIKYGAFQSIGMKETESGGVELELDSIDPEELPSVSILSVVDNPEDYISILLYNWNQLTYASDKREWIIIDIGTQPIEDYIPIADHTNIRYTHCPGMEPHEALNTACEQASHDLCCIMDDSTYYYPDHLVVKVSAHLTYGSNILTADVPIFSRGTFYVHPQIKKHVKTNAISYPSILFTKQYWHDNPFTSDVWTFVGRRFNQWKDVKFPFNCIRIHLDTVNQVPSEYITIPYTAPFPPSFQYILEKYHQAHNRTSSL